MGADLAAVDAVLKDQYRPKVVSVINNKARLLKEIFGGLADGKIDAEGRQLVYALRTDRNQGVGFIGEDDNLPTAGNQGTSIVKIAYKYCEGRIQLTIQTIKASKSDKGSFKRVMKDEMSGLADDMTRLRNRVLWGDGTGVLARVNGGAAAGDTVINLKSPYGITGTVGGARLILKNSYIAFVRNATPTAATDGDIQAVKKVSSVSSDKTSITLTATVGVALNDNDLVVLAPAGGDVTNKSSVNKEAMGLKGIVDDGTYIGTLHNISRTATDAYNASVIALNGAFSLDVLQRAYDLADEKAGGEISHLLAHHSVRREYLKTLQIIKRYTNEMAMKPDGGFKGGGISTDIEYAEKPMIAERMCPYATIFGVDKSDGVRAVNCEGEWADETGAILKQVANKDTFTANFRVFENWHNDRPDKCFRIDGVQATVDVVAVE